MYSTISEVASLKNRITRFVGPTVPILSIILGTIVGITISLYDTSPGKQHTFNLLITILVAMFIQFLTNIIIIIRNDFNENNNGPDISATAVNKAVTQLIPFNLIMLIIPIIAIVLNNQGKTAIFNANTALEPVISFIAKALLGILAIFMFIVSARILLPLIWHFAMWLSWNGYNENFIAITRRGNIREYNRIPEIHKKLSKSATPDDIASAIAKNRTLVKTNYPQKWLSFNN